MAKNNPPDGFSLGVGTWITDADENTSLHTTGNSSVELKNTLVATSLESDLVPVELLAPYKIDAILRATNVSGSGHTVRLRVEEFSSSKASIGTTDIDADAIPIANQWKRVSGIITPGSGTRFISVQADKSATNFTVYVDRLASRRTPRAFSGSQNADTTVATSTWTKVDFQVQDYDHGNLFSASQFTAPYAGVYHFDTSILWDNTIADGITIAAAFYKNGSEIRRFYNGSTAKANEFYAMAGACDLELAPLDTVAVYIFQASGGNINTEQSPEWVWFTGREVR